MKRNREETLVLGLTGGVGSGKSEAVAYLERRYKANALRADDIARNLMLSDGPCFAPVLELFGEEILSPVGELNRGAIAEIVFSDPEMLKKLNAIVHPAVRVEVEKQVAEAREAGGKILCLEAAILLEEDYDNVCDEVWYIRVPDEARIRRLLLTRGYSEEKTRRIMRNQLSEEEYSSRCDVVIDNDGDVADLRAAVDERMAQLL